MRIDVVSTEQDTVFNLKSKCDYLLRHMVCHLVVVAFASFHLNIGDAKICPTLYCCPPIKFKVNRCTSSQQTNTT